MTIAQFFSKSTLVVITLLASVNLLYAQGVPDIPKELILKNKVKSLKVFLTTKGSGAKPLKNLEVVKIKYNKNGDEIAKSIYSWYDVVDYIDSDTMIYNSKNQLVETRSQRKTVTDNNTDPMIKMMQSFADIQTKYTYEYDKKGNLIKEFSHSEGEAKEEVRYVYDQKGRKIQKIRFGSQKDTTFFKYNTANQCIEEGRYTKYGNKEVCTYAKNGLLEKMDLYQDADVFNRTLDKAWRTFIYYYNDKKQLIKKEIKHPEKKMDWVITYTYGANDLPKEQMEDMGTSTYTFTTVYEYWGK